MEAGADFCGFIVDIPRSPRSLQEEQARELITGCGPRAVLVIEDMVPGFAVRLAQQTGAAALQVHGEVSGDHLSSLVQGLRERAEVWRCLGLPARTQDRERLVAEVLAAIEELALLGVGRVVLDTRTERGVGGSGTRCDWEAAAEIVKSAALPVILAGGLAPENLRADLEQVRPAGVDLSSSLESRPGVKDPERMRQLRLVWQQLQR